MEKKMENEMEAAIEAFVGVSPTSRRQQAHNDKNKDLHWIRSPHVYPPI